MSIQPWPPTTKKLQAVDGNGSTSWKTDPEYFSKYYLGSQTKDNLADGTYVRLDLGVLVGISHLIASKKVPYKDTSEFVRDSTLKNLRFQGEHLDEPEILRIVRMVETHAQSIHEEKVMEMNDKFLKVRKRKLDNAKAPTEIKKVLDLCERARPDFEGYQLDALDEIIAECKRRIPGGQD